MDDTLSQVERPRVRAGVGWWVAGVFFLVAAWLGSRPELSPIPLAPMAAVTRADLRVGPRREAMRDPPSMVVDGRVRTCGSCHRIVAPERAGGRAALVHGEIVLNHGQNDRCLNCHDTKNLDRLVLPDGSGLTFEQTPRLCAQCHGTVYRDWQNGTHGKTLGAWDRGTGKQVRLACNQCHDPHSPAYERLRPLPGPNTLRMGPQDAVVHMDGGEKESPLESEHREGHRGGAPVEKHNGEAREVTR